MEKKVMSFNAAPDVAEFLQSIQRLGNCQSKSSIINISVRLYMERLKLLNNARQ